MQFTGCSNPRTIFTCCGENRVKTTMSMTQCGAYMRKARKRSREPHETKLLMMYSVNVLVLISES